VQLLSRYRADINQGLVAASEAGHVEIARRLLQEGADMNAKDDRGRTALDYAEEYGHEELKYVLEQMGAKRQALSEDKDGSPGVPSVSRSKDPNTKPTKNSLTGEVVAAEPTRLLIRPVSVERLDELIEIRVGTATRFKRLRRPVNGDPVAVTYRDKGGDKFGVEIEILR
jgi:hypothetical protein